MKKLIPLPDCLERGEPDCAAQDAPPPASVTIYDETLPASVTIYDEQGEMTDGLYEKLLAQAPKWEEIGGRFAFFGGPMHASFFGGPMHASTLWIDSKLSRQEKHYSDTVG